VLKFYATKRKSLLPFVASYLLRCLFAQIYDTPTHTHTCTPLQKMLLSKKRDQQNICIYKSKEKRNRNKHYKMHCKTLLMRAIKFLMPYSPKRTSPYHPLLFPFFILTSPAITAIKFAMTWHSGQKLTTWPSKRCCLFTNVFCMI